MEVLYRAFGLGGGSWRSCIFSKDGLCIDYYESDHQRLAGVSEMVEEDIDLLNNTIKTGSRVNFVTNIFEEELPSSLELESREYLDSVHTGYRPCKSEHSSDLWSLSSYLCDHGLYDFKLTENPEPPYKIYTDASYWPDLDQGSIGFVVKGSNKGIYAVGCPIFKSLIPNNNIAEFYAALAAFKSVESNVKAKVITDSTNLAGVLRREYEDRSCKTTDDLIETSEKFDSLDVNTSSRKQVVVSDVLAEIGKNNPVVFGSEPRIS